MDQYRHEESSATDVEEPSGLERRRMPKIGDDDEGSATKGEPVGADGDLTIFSRGEEAQLAASSTSTSHDDGDQEPAASDRESRRLRGEALGLVVLVVLALVCAGLITAVVIKTRNDATLAAREAAAYTPPPLTSSSAADSSTITIISDEAASRAADGVSAAQRWPALLGRGLDLEVELLAATGVGYTASTNGATFVDRASQVSPDARYVVFVGATEDAGSSALTVARAATQAYAAATERAPEAEVLVIGPLFRSSSVSSSDLDELRSTLRSASRIAGVDWVDPIASKWVPSVERTSDLSAARERTVASRVMEALRSADG